MRVPISFKLSVAFLALFLLTSTLAIFMWSGLSGLRASVREVGGLKDFQVSLKSLEVFNWGPEARLPVDRKARFEAQFDDLLKRVETFQTNSGSLPEKTLGDLRALKNQISYFRTAFEELMEMQGEDERLHQKQHALMEALAQKLRDSRNDDLRKDFATMLMYWGRAYHDRDTHSMANLHRLVDEAQGKQLDPSTKKLMVEVERTLDRNYINYLGILEKETFLAGASRRYGELANLAVDAIYGFEQRRQRTLVIIVGSSLGVLIVLTSFFWYWANRYLSTFLGNSRQIVGSIKQGGMVPERTVKSDDEFGDLIVFMEEMSQNLNQKMAIIRASEEKYRGLVEDISDWVWEADGNGICVYSSPAVKRILGFSVEETEGRSMREILCRENMADKEHFACEESLRTGVNVTDFLSTTRKADGTPASLESNMKPTFDKEGRVVGIRGISRDVTERLLAEAERREMQDQLLHAQKMEAVGTLSGGVAHDFNNLLQSIGGYADLLLERGELSEKDRGSVNRIAQSISSATRLTQQLLLFSRRAETTLSPMEVNQEIVKTTEMMERIIPRNIAIITRLSPDLPMILADPMQLEQVLMNFIINARDAMEEGGTITVASTLIDQDHLPEMGVSTGPFVAISVSDNGKGIPPEIRDRIFEPFFTTKEVGKGTGLGLAIVYGIAKAHGASVTCESELGRGTTFTLYFAAKPVTMAKRSDEKRETASAQPKSQGQGVLVVDDEQGIRETCAEIMALEGYKVFAARSGEEGLDVFVKNSGEIHLVLLDLNMPGMGGAECFVKLRELSADLPIIVASGFSEVDIKNSRTRQEATAFLKKPYRMRSLIDAVTRALS